MGNNRNPSAFKFFDVGFHGDRYLLDLVLWLLDQKVELFIETGTNVGSTLAYVAKTFPEITCLSCEPYEEAFQHAKNNTSDLKNVKLYNLTSQDFIRTISDKHPEYFEKKTFFWLDAHSYGFQWPLKEEVSFAAEKFKNAYMMIDDFKVPNNPSFNYDRYEDQLCAHEFIENSIGERPYQLYYPAYTDKTSTFHPLQGWGLYVFGENLNLPKEIINSVKKEH